MIGTVFSKSAGGLWRQFEQRFDRLPRPELQHLSKQNQDGNHRGSLEVGGDRAVVRAERGGEDLRATVPIKL